MRGLLKAIAVLSLLLACLIGGGYLRLEQWAHAPIDVPAEAVVELHAGTTLTALSAELSLRGAVSSAAFFNAWVRIAGNYQRYQAGRYRFVGAVAPADVALAMLKGDVWNPIVLQVAVPEGYRTKDLAERLAANGVGHIVEITRLMHDHAFLQSLNVPSTSLEGYIFPATYAFHEMPTATEALTQMVKTFWQSLPKNYENSVAGMGLSLGQAVTFASLIELETRLDDEKPLISEVIWRRLKDKAPLAIDAALIYGIPDYQGVIRSVHLVDAKNPYNTRIHVGLPPTPIGSPSVKSLEAVLHPTNFGYYYYVLVPDGSRHHFSKTLQEHNLNVKKLVNASKHTKKSGGN